MSTFLDRALPFTLKYEGGYSNNPDDSGGPTNMGITQRTYDAARKEWGLNTLDVRYISAPEAQDIYLKKYWRTAHCDSFPEIVAIALFDFYLQNPRVAAQKLQFIAEMDDADGVIGPKTIAAVNAHCPDEETTKLFVRDYLRSRQAFYHKIVNNDPKKKTFLRGWLIRVADLAEYLEVSDNQLIA